MVLEYIKSEVVEDGIAVVTIDRPPVNAMDSDSMGELFECLYKLSKNKQVRVVILTAAGEKIFVGGADVREFLEYDAVTGPRFTARNNYVRNYLYNFPMPVICAMNGSAYGAGIGLGLCSDIRLCPPNAKFNLGEINMGILGLTQHMSRRTFNGAARKYLYTGEVFDAQEAYRIGLIDELAPREKIMERAMEIARSIASKSPRAIAEIKQCLLASDAGNMGDPVFEEGAVRRLWATSDKDEAVNSFLEKRPAKFQNK